MPFKSNGVMSGIVFEAHSTDYQNISGLSALVEGGFSILKVGPWLTFALREALYGLDAISDVLDGHAPQNRLMDAMEAFMANKPDNWAKYYEGNAEELFVQRHFSFSDRIRYYWPDQKAVQAAEALRSRIGNKNIPAPLLSQYLPNVSRDSFDGMLIQAVTNVLEVYDRATIM
ncbi:MAG: class II D-tagatose-bisphosphate aldolase, non-catalytic subunit [Marivivens sp.]|jgi:D-tagatose-1,6-bisphosphate aldolase subunit GatZ/KbaZ|nr:class II D-tagatose-bisphosphate aldolase, non-catalytic subunit [Marivivens sp.]